MITYTVNDVSSNIRFHTVISEAHEATSEITKFPVQSGFSISNHAIRKNRVVTIEGMITNTVLANGANSIIYSQNNSKTIFEVLETLVNSSIPCEVTTNLGNYSPVVFNKFSTKQVAGMTDAMTFTIRGEEIQVRSTLNKTAPKVLTFIEIGPEQYAARLAELNALGYAVPNGAVISETKATLGQDYTIRTPNTKGVLTDTVYVNTGYSEVTGEYTYDVNENPAPVVAAVAEEGFNPWSLAGKFASSVSPCLVDGAIDVAVNMVGDVVESYMGKARKALYGIKNNIMQLGGGIIGAPLMGVLVDCVVAGATDVYKDYADEILPEGSAIKDSAGLPTTQNILDGVTKVGQAAQQTPLREITLTKISGFGALL